MHTEFEGEGELAIRKREVFGKGMGEGGGWCKDQWGVELKNKAFYANTSSCNPPLNS